MCECPVKCREWWVHLPCHLIIGHKVGKGLHIVKCTTPSKGEGRQAWWKTLCCTLLFHTMSVFLLLFFLAHSLLEYVYAFLYVLVKQHCIMEGQSSSPKEAAHIKLIQKISYVQNFYLWKFCSTIRSSLAKYSIGCYKIHHDGLSSPPVLIRLLPLHVVIEFSNSLLWVNGRESVFYTTYEFFLATTKTFYVSLLLSSPKSSELTCTWDTSVCCCWC